MRYEEKKVLKKFAFFYFGVTFVLLFIVFALIYNSEIEHLKSLTKEKMKNYSFKISSNIIMAQMENKKLELEKFKKYNFELLDKNNNTIYGKKLKNFDLKIEDKSPLGHMGVWKVIIYDNSFSTLKSDILKKLILGFILLYTLIAMLGYYLIKLFLKPIKDSQEKLDRFLKDTTHELNTPISALLLSINDLNNPKNVDRIKLSALRISKLYKDLTYIFLEDNKKREIKQYLLKSLILEQLEFFEPLALKKKIKIYKDLDNSTINIDKEDFERLFSNLISNTIKYNKRGGKVEIILKNSTLTIRDSGIGIDSKNLNDIFVRYFRATNIDGGFGIGLSIVKDIVKRYNIDIKVKSIKDVGTEFILKFL